MSAVATGANIQKHNRRREDYFAKRRHFNEILAEVDNFIEPGDTGVQAALKAMGEIAERISNIEDFFDEFGYLTSYEETETDAYRIKKIERSIGNGDTLTLGSVPAEYRDHFRRLLDRHAADYQHHDHPRAAEDIRNDIGTERAALEESFLLSDDFSSYLPANRVKTSAKTNEIREILNDLRDEYYETALDLINHF